MPCCKNWQKGEDKGSRGPELSNSRKNNTNPNQDDENNTAVKITNGSFKWSSNDEESNLKDIDLNVKKNSLVAVVGAVGSGKSSLMSAILGKLISSVCLQIVQSSV